MKIRTILIGILLFQISLISFSQAVNPRVQATMTSTGNNSVMLKVKPSQTFSGQITGIVFAVQLPNTIMPRPTVTIKSNPLSANVPTSGYVPVLETDEGGFYTYVIAATTNGSPVFNFTNGTEVSVLEIQFNGGGGSTLSRLAHLPDGGTSLQAAFYIEVGGVDNSNYSSIFYGPGFMNGGGYSTYSYLPLSVILPVKFTSFDVMKKANDAIIDWSVSNEDANTNRYEIERSVDGAKFETIQTLLPLNNGSSSNVYSKIDASLTSIRNVGLVIYYRVKQIDNDGKFTTTEVKAVRLSTKGNEITAFPNPIKDITTIQLDFAKAEEVTMNLYDSEGKSIQNYTIQATKGVNIKKIDMNNLAAGNYLLKITTSTDVKTIKLIKL